MNQANIPPPLRTPAMWKTIALFAVLGPFIGGLIGLMVMVLFSGKIATLADFGSMSLVTLIFGYVFGLLPAALTGLAVALSNRGQSHRSPVRLGAVWGAILAGVTGLQIAWLGDGERFVFTILLFAIMGSAAGLVCGWLLLAKSR